MMSEPSLRVIVLPFLFCPFLELGIEQDNISQNSENKPQGLYFSKALFEGLIFGGAYIRRGLSTEGNLRFKIDWASLIVERKFTVFALFYFVFESNFQVQAYLEGRFNGGFFALRVWGTYIWRGLFSEFYGMQSLFNQARNTE